MKKKVLCFFALILYLLCACTMLSEKIEQEMATLVQIDLRTASGSIAPTNQSVDVLFTDENGQHLYEVIDGAGWSTGLRIHEIPEEVWRIGYSRGPYVEINGGSDYRFVKSASRQPPDGKLAEIIDEFETAEDQYIMIYSGSIPENSELPENSDISIKSDNILLLNMKQAELPFFEHKVKTLSDATGAADRIFSLTEVEMFLEELPDAAMVCTVLIFGVVLWGFSCCLSIRTEETKAFIGINAALVIASLGFMWFLLRGIDLPASLLPAENIFDWQYYLDEFTLIFGSLEDLEVTAVLSTRDSLLAQCLDIYRHGILAILAAIFVEIFTLWIIKWNQMRKHKRHIGKHLSH